MRSLTGKEVVRAFEKAGFVVVRISSSHHVMKRERHPNTVSVPMHAGKTIKKGTLSGLIRLAGLTRQEFEAFLDSCNLGP